MCIQYVIHKIKKYLFKTNYFSESQFVYIYYSIITEPLLSGIVLGLVPTQAGLLVTAYLQSSWG
jgi:hypothetical protein